MRRPVAVVALGQRSLGLAERVKTALDGLDPRAPVAIHAPEGTAGPADRRFPKLAPHLRELFTSGQAIVGLCAAGILIRALAPVLRDKRDEPPVVAVAEDGTSVVPLLGGHRGANELARRIAAALDAHAAITTAGDLRLGLALDEPPPGWRLKNPADVKEIVTRLLHDASVRLVAEAGDAAWLRRGRLRFDEAGEVAIRMTHRAVEPAPGQLVYHPPVLALGVGAARGADPDALIELAATELARHGLAAEAVACIASLDLKAAEPAVHALAVALGVPARFLTAERLNAEREQLTTPSERVHRETGVWGVAEGAALAAAGPDGRLLVPKRVGRGVTCAVALAAHDIDPRTVGRARGHLAVVGIGPGDRASRTGAAVAAIRAADTVVGYELYLDLVADLTVGKDLRRFPLGEETERCRAALELAAEGRNVALVSSGDPGIYAMASLVMELLDREATPATARVEVEVIPGISAMQAAAARLGAPLGHDFCAISLSDLLTPFEAIERRLRAAAEADFVVALYNPVSARRRVALERARAILLEHRPPETPVALARNLGRADESVRIVPLVDLGVDEVDMLTLVLVGSRATRRVPQLHGADRLCTPRGYRLA